MKNGPVNWHRVISISSILILGLLIPALPSGAAIKAGAVCKKAQQVRVVKGDSFTCVKKGKRLVWRKSGAAPIVIPAVEVAPSPSPSPSESATPTASPTPTPKPISTIPSIGKGGGFVYRYVEGKQQRLNVDGDWYLTDDRSETSFDPIRVSAYRSITSLPIDPKHTKIKFDYLQKPEYPVEIAKVVKNQIVDVAQKFSPLFDRSLTIRVFLITEKDQDFINRDLPSIIPSFEPRSLSFMSNYLALNTFYSMGGTGGGQAGYVEAKDYGFYLAHTSSLAELDTYWPEVPPHEMAHVLQFFLARNHQSQFGEGHPEAKWHGHLIEGSANTLGMALGFENLGWYSDEMDRLLVRNINNQRFKNSLSMESIEDAVALIKMIENRSTEIGNEFSYSAGQIVWEYFIGKHGVDKFIEFLKNLPKTRNFNENLKLTIGMDREAFYKEAGQYLLQTWKRLSK